MAERNPSNQGQTGNKNVQGAGGNVGGTQGGRMGGQTGGNVGGATGGTTGGMGGVGSQQEITRLLDNVNFPVTKQDLISKVGNQSINLQGRQMPVRDVLNKINKDRFTDKNEIVRELGNLPEFKGSMGGQTGGTTGGFGSQTGGGVGGTQGRTGGGRQ